MININENIIMAKKEYINNNEIYIIIREIMKIIRNNERK